MDNNIVITFVATVSTITVAAYLGVLAGLLASRQA